MTFEEYCNSEFFKKYWNEYKEEHPKESVSIANSKCANSECPNTVGSMPIGVSGIYWCSVLCVPEKVKITVEKLLTDEINKIKKIRSKYLDAEYKPLGLKDSDFLSSVGIQW